MENSIYDKCVYFSVNRPIQYIFASSVIPSGRISLKEGYFTHTCIYVTIRPYVNSKHKIIQTSHIWNLFLLLVLKERIRKGSDILKKSGGHCACNKNILTPS